MEQAAPEVRATIPPAPAADVPIEVRLTSPYGAFTLEELAKRLVLCPLRPLEVEPVEPRKMSVYTVVRLPEVDFTDPAVRAGYGPFLSGLAQVEEESQPGADPENLPVPALVPLAPNSWHGPMHYHPTPIPTDDVVLGPAVLALTERLAENAHDVWARQRIADGWTYGPVRDAKVKTDPCLAPYDRLSEAEKVYDRNAAMQTLKAIIALGYRVVPA